MSETASHGIRINWAFEEIGCLCGAAGLDDAGALTSHLIAAANAEELRDVADFIAETAGIGESTNDFGRGWYGALDYAVGSLRDRGESIAATEQPEDR